MAFGKQELTQIINEALHEIGASGISFSVEQPQELAHGDYATNAALVACKILNISPKECAEKIVATLKKGEGVKDVHIAGLGFINFFLKDEIVREYNKSEHTIQTIFSGKNILVEHSSLNLFKPFTIGHLVNNFVGEFIARALDKGGAHVKTMSFPSDVSLGIAKAVYVIKQDGGFKDNPTMKTFSEPVAYYGEAYRRGVTLYDERPELQDEIKKISDDIYNTVTTEEVEVYKQAKEENVRYFFDVLEKLGSHFDDVTYEGEAGHIGTKIVREHMGTIFTTSEDAVVYIPDESRKDLHTAVFINSEGHPTYEAKDIGLIDIKFRKFNPEYSFFVTDSEQISHFKIVLDAASKISEEWKARVEKSKHIPHGRMLFKGEKMSSRLGGVPLALDVIGAVEEEVRARAGEKIDHLHIDDKKKLEREIALSALRVAVLRSKPGININFDPETSLSFEGDSGPYLLYTHARCSSLLDKGKERGYGPSFSHGEVFDIERTLIHFEEQLVDAIETLSPQKLVAQLFVIAQAFNSFYGQEQIISDDKEKSEHNLAIVKRTQEVLKRGLYVLGIEAPERM